MASDADKDEDRLGKLVCEYMDRLVEGETIDPDAVLKEQPELGPAILSELRTFTEIGSHAGSGSNDDLGTLGDYELRRPIGRGGMGVVYEAWQHSMDRRVALKVLPAGIAADAKTLTRFVREAHIAGKLQHPNVVPVFGMGVEAKTPYYAMEMVDGETLAELLKRSRLEQVDTKRCFELAAAFAGAAEGLQHAHEQGVVHRDLKPSNLMLDREGRLRILDFGLARLEGEESLTLSGDLVGTPQYMSPEQARRKSIPIDHRTDVYSLGATLYEVLTRRPPFKGKDHQDTLSQIITRDPASPRSINSRLPKDLETIVLKCLRKEPADRYGTAEALAQDLRRFARGDAIEARPQPGWERVARRVWRHKARLVVGAVVIVAVVCVGLLLRQSAVERRKQCEEDVRAQVVKLELCQNPYGFRRAIETAMVPESWLRAIDEVLNELQQAEAVLSGNPAVHYHRARALALIERDAEALEELDKALRIDPRFVPAMGLRALIFELNDDSAGSKKELAKAETAGAGTWGSAWLRAHQLALEMRWSESAAAYGELVELSGLGHEPYLGAFIDALLDRGVVRLEAKEHEKALADFSAAEILWPGFFLEATLLKGQAFYMLGRKDLAAEEFEKTFARSKRQVEIANHISGLYGYVGDYEKSLEWAERPVHSPSPGFEARVMPQRSWCLMSLGRFEAAQQELEKSLELAPGSARLWIHAGWIYHNLGRPERAEECFRQAKALDSNLASSYAGLGFVLTDRGEFAEAKLLFQEGLRHCRRSPEAMLGLGRALTQEGNLKEGEKWLRKTIVLDPDKAPMNWVHLGTNLLEQGRFEEAVAALEKSRERWRANHYADEPLGDAFLRLGQVDRALEAFRRAADFSPEETWARQRLGETLVAAGRFEEAIDEYAKLVTQDPNRGEAYKGVVHALRRLEKPLHFEGPVGRLKAALEGAQRAGVDDPHLLDALALIRMRIEPVADIREALALAERAAEVTQRKDPDVLATLEEAQFLAGDSEHAVTTLTEAIKLPHAKRYLLDEVERYRRLGLLAADYKSSDAMLAAPSARVALAVGESLRIRCGGEEYQGHDGKTWLADRFFTGGNSGRPFRGEVSGTEDGPLYQSERWFPADEIGPAGYRIPLEPGRYRVTLHFAEVWFAAPGLRKFDIVIEGRRVHEDYEPIAAGFATARQEELDVTLEDGLLEIELVPKVENPEISAIEIERIE